MAFFTDKADGCFKIKQTNTTYDFRKTTDEWAIKQGCTHEIAICCGGIRFVKLLKTVAYIAVNKDEFGNAIFEKFGIVIQWGNIQ